MTVGLRPVRVGPVAAEILRHDGEADVAAVFERSFYVAAPRGYICIGVADIGDGPLNVLLATDGGVFDWARLGITREAKGVVANGRLSIGDDFTLQLADVPEWQPPPWPATSRAQLTASLAALRAVAAPLCPAEGLSRLVIGDPARADRTAKAAAALVVALRTGLDAGLQSNTAGSDLLRTATLLLGLGPGLTPSGDDLIGGVFVLLSAVGRAGLRDQLWAALQPELDDLTVGISAAHLAAAADGLGASAVHAMLDAILTGDAGALSGHLRAIARIGHSSGFDTLAGMVLAADAIVAYGG